MRRHLSILLASLALGAAVLSPSAQADTLQGTVSGRVVDVAGDPVAGIVVRAGDGASTVTTDSDGRYEVGAPTDGSWFIVTFRDPVGWHVGAQRGGFTLEPDATLEDVDVTLQDGGRLRGRVVDSAGRPVKCDVVAPQDSYARTAADGTFTTYPTLPGSSRATFNCAPSQTFRPLTLSTSIAAGELNNIGEIVLERFVVIQGRILVPSGTSPQGLSVSIRYDKGSGYYSSSTTDAVGRYRLGGIEPGRPFVLTVRDPRGETVEVRSKSFTAQANDVIEHDQTLRRGGRITVHLEGSDGRPVGADVDVEASGSYGPTALVTTRDDEADLSGLPQGRWRVRAWHAVVDGDRNDWFLGPASASVKVYAGKTTDLRLSLAVGGRIVGKVTTRDGVRPKGAEVTLLRWRNGSYEDVPSSLSWSSRARANVEDDGTYRLGPVPAGRYRTVVHLTGRYAKTDDVVVKSRREVVRDMQLGYRRVGVTKVPELVGTLRVGRLLRVTAGAWDPRDASVEYRWYLGGRRISPTTTRTWRLPARAAGKEVRVVAVATAPRRASQVRTALSSGRVRR